MSAYVQRVVDTKLRGVSASMILVCLLHCVTCELEGGSIETSDSSLADPGEDNQREKIVLDQLRRNWMAEDDKLFTDDEFSGDGNIERKIFSSLIHTLPTSRVVSLTNSGYKSYSPVFIQPTQVFSSDIVSISTSEDFTIFSDIDDGAQHESIKTSGLYRSSIPYRGPSSLLNILIFKPSPTYKELPMTPSWTFTPSVSQKISSKKHFYPSFRYSTTSSFTTGPTSSSLLNVRPSFVTPTEAFLLLRSSTKACTPPPIESSFKCNSDLDIEEDIETSLIETNTNTQLTSEHTAFPIVRQLSYNLERNAMISTDSGHGIVSVTVATTIPIFEGYNKNFVRNPTKEVNTSSVKVYTSAPLSSEPSQQTAATENPTESEQGQHDSENELKDTNDLISSISNLPEYTHKALPLSLYSSFSETSKVLENQSVFEISPTVSTRQSQQSSFSVSKPNMNSTVEEAETNSTLQASSYHSNISITEAPSAGQFNFHSWPEYSLQSLSPTSSTRAPTVSQTVTNRERDQTIVSSSAVEYPILLSPTFLDYGSFYNANREISTFHKTINSQLFIQPPVSDGSVTEFNIPTSKSIQVLSYFVDSTNDLSSINISPTSARNKGINEESIARSARDGSTMDNNNKPQFKRPGSPVRSSSNQLLSSVTLKLQRFKTIEPTATSKQSKTETSRKPTERSNRVTGFPFELPLNTRKELLESTSNKYDYTEEVPFIYTTDRVNKISSQSNALKLTSISSSSKRSLLSSTMPDLYTSTIPDLYTSTIPDLYTSTIPDLYTSTMPDLYTSTIPDLCTSTVPDLLYTSMIATPQNIPVDISSTKTTDISHIITITTNSGFSSTEGPSFMNKTKKSIQTVLTTSNVIWTTTDNYSNSAGMQEMITPTTTISSQIHPNTNRQTSTPTEVSTTKVVMGSQENSKQPDKKFWIRTVIEADPLRLPSNFLTIMKERLKLLYEQAFEKREDIHFGIHKKKREAVWKGRINIQLWNCTVDSDLNHVMLVYTVSRDEKPILAEIAVTDVELLRSDDVTLILGYVVVTRAEAYLEPPEKQSDKTPEWVTYAVLGGLAGFVVFVITCLIIYCQCCRPRGPPPTQVEQPDIPHSYGQQNLQQVFEQETVRLDLRGETEAKDGTESKVRDENIRKECENYRPLPVPPEKQPDEPIKCGEGRSSSYKKALKTRSDQKSRTLVKEKTETEGIVNVGFEEDRDSPVAVASTSSTKNRSSSEEQLQNRGVFLSRNEVDLGEDQTELFDYLPTPTVPCPNRELKKNSEINRPLSSTSSLAAQHPIKPTSPLGTIWSVSPRSDRDDSDIVENRKAALLEQRSIEYEPADTLSDTDVDTVNKELQLNTVRRKVSQLLDDAFFLAAPKRLYSSLRCKKISPTVHGTSRSTSIRSRSATSQLENDTSTGVFLPDQVSSRPMSAPPTSDIHQEPETVSVPPHKQPPAKPKVVWSIYKAGDEVTELKNTLKKEYNLKRSKASENLTKVSDDERFHGRPVSAMTNTQSFSKFGPISAPSTSYGAFESSASSLHDSFNSFPCNQRPRLFQQRTHAPKASTSCPVLDILHEDPEYTTIGRFRSTVELHTQQRGTTPDDDYDEIDTVNAIRIREPALSVIQAIKDELRKFNSSLTGNSTESFA
ncbi:uncharacterized protein LOC143238900 [Tachypleus tridentatus]|uniref:uncharacterized protein LOC143238900 n=1 Tax=Tachypleus tridentatus TaxID=6853 RepID=UPI003FD0386E